MRNKFTDMIANGVASFNYIPTNPETTAMDPICRTYNNVFAMATDTHMHLLDDGRRVITGHMINSRDWEIFMGRPDYANIDFRTTGYDGFADFLRKFGLCGEIGSLNGDVVYFVNPCDHEKHDHPKNLTESYNKVRSVVYRHLENAMEELAKQRVYPSQDDVERACEWFAMEYNF